MGKECRVRNGRENIQNEGKKKEQWLENCLYMGGRKEGDKR
jgi:hypothetical protein